ncbi:MULTISPECIES: ParB/RepB/Spo0J family partition protein [Chromobacteriaceae]|uniref:ParB/RepB/Spo0J family partition protein n=3 Tax=Chromobacteriaceae TaxID=1499392 RepID=A0ABV0H208_9NEIS|nr:MULTISPECIES: ParB/RepB/Spo0J family partition protein [Chromobacteriaceae]AVG14857.1 chromosome partitioning protein ParB [Chromobacterium vaccinii]ERE21152.1 chromosome partitioning protein ParB [Pseudogulbenkiania ferrooxidans EGD-HP2]MBX9298207.1 ParB/RepB/Spo0J family partition protein [Chromobacterium vaccinii]MBX9349183.1 ParB/RepB/Spo0J family partition protein [Chromobacterium vaccinii]MBX9357828.1 ParB/RepB/Spo0J family partition protein [Chromobacterium vaccinii]
MAKLKGLGRGLDALLSTVDAVDDRLSTLPIDSIRPGKYQPRSFMNEAALDELAASIRAQGIIQPLIVRELGLGDYELIAGERRWRASRKAGLSEVPVVIKSVPDEAALAMALIENIQRQELDPIEEAQGIKRLVDEFGLTHEAAADAVGRSRSAVSNLLRLLALPQPLQQMMHEGQLEMGHARALLSLPTVSQLELANEAVRKGMSVREVERRVQQHAAQKTTVAPQQKRVDPDVARLEEQVSEAIGARVSIRQASGGCGKLVIDYASLDELDFLLEKLQKNPKK